jgi:hypothetical protein
MSKGLMRIMDGTGDNKVIWNSNSAVEVEAARDMFDKLIKKGYKAFSVTKDGDKDGMITKFDPSLEKIILAPQISGG